jgi:hypothetical protein
MAEILEGSVMSEEVNIEELIQILRNMPKEIQEDQILINLFNDFDKFNKLNESWFDLPENKWLKFLKEQ